MKYRLDWVSKDLIEKPVEGRRGPATVSASESAIVTEGSLGKAQRSDDLEPGELPDRRSPLRPARDGEGDFDVLR